VFDPNACADHCPADLGRYINDLIVRTLAGVPQAGRPVFLKIVYHGPKAMEELAAYDPHLVPGILGGSSGTTYDAFKLLTEAKKYGARAALYGRKINNSEHQLTFVSFLRLLADGQISAEEATRAYHGELQKLGIKPLRPLADDMQLTTQRRATRRRHDDRVGGVPARRRRPKGTRPAACRTARPKARFRRAAEGAGDVQRVRGRPRRLPGGRRSLGGRATAGPVVAETVIPSPAHAATHRSPGQGQASRRPVPTAAFPCGRVARRRENDRDGSPDCSIVAQRSTRHVRATGY
jgi:hypothetical protein